MPICRDRRGLRGLQSTLPTSIIDLPQDPRTTSTGSAGRRGPARSGSISLVDEASAFSLEGVERFIGQRIAWSGGGRAVPAEIRPTARGAPPSAEAGRRAAPGTGARAPPGAPWRRPPARPPLSSAPGATSGLPSAERPGPLRPVPTALRRAPRSPPGPPARQRPGAPPRPPAPSAGLESSARSARGPRAPRSRRSGARRTRTRSLRRWSPRRYRHRHVAADADGDAPGAGVGRRRTDARHVGADPEVHLAGARPGRKPVRGVDQPDRLANTSSTK